MKFSTLQQYGVDKVFFLERNNVDASQRRIVFLTRGEDADRGLGIAGKSTPPSQSWFQDYIPSLGAKSHTALHFNSLLQQHDTLTTCRTGQAFAAK